MEFIHYSNKSAYASSSYESYWYRPFSFHLMTGESDHSVSIMTLSLHANNISKSSFLNTDWSDMVFKWNIMIALHVLFPLSCFLHSWVVKFHLKTSTKPLSQSILVDQVHNMSCWSKERVNRSMYYEFIHMYHTCCDDSQVEVECLSGEGHPVIVEDALVLPLASFGNVTNLFILLSVLQSWSE